MGKFILEYRDLLEFFKGKGEILAKPFATGVVDYVKKEKPSEVKKKKIKEKDIEKYLYHSNSDWKNLPSHIKDLSIKMAIEEFKRNEYKIV